MQIKLITLSFSPALGAFDTRPLDSFVADKEVLALREHFFEVHEQPYLACLVTWQVGPSPAATSEAGDSTDRRGRARKGAAVDVPEEARGLFETLRAWRLERSRQDGVPPFVVFTNRELAAIAVQRPASRNALTNLPGIGSGKAERYGGDLLSLLDSATQEKAPPNGTPS